jgi:hypothetical protein
METIQNMYIYGMLNIRNLGTANTVPCNTTGQLRSSGPALLEGKPGHFRPREVRREERKLVLGSFKEDRNGPFMA